MYSRLPVGVYPNETRSAVAPTAASLLKRLDEKRTTIEDDHCNRYALEGLTVSTHYHVSCLADTWL